MVDTAIDHELLHQAVRDDDVATVEAILLATADIQELVRSLNTSLATSVGAERNPFAEKSFRPFFLFCPRHVKQQSRLLAGEAARRGCLNVLAWFFARERVELMGSSLAFVLPRIIKHARSTAALEILLTSDVFCNLLSATKQQKVMREAFVRARNPAVVAQLVAHGLELSSAAVEQSTTRSGTQGLLDAIVEHGGTVVGADLVVKVDPQRRARSILSHTALTRRLLELGADAGTFLGDALITAARSTNVATVQLLLERGFADVDARASDGLTALTVTAADNRACLPCGVLELVRILMAYGATYAHIISENPVSVRAIVRFSIQKVLKEQQSADEASTVELPP